MPPPPVAMAASKLQNQALEEQLKQKNRIINAYESQKRTRLACEAERAKQKEFAKMNRGWRKHNANPYTPQLYRSEGITEDEDGNIKREKVIFITEYKFAMERVKEMNAEAELAERRARMLRGEQEDAYRKTQELMKVAEELEVKVARETRMRIARYSPAEDQDTAITDGNSTDSDDDMNIRELSTPNAPRHARLVLHPPNREGSLSIDNIRPTRLRKAQPKRERSVSVEEYRSTRLRLSQPRRERSVSVEEVHPTRLILSQPKRERSMSVEEIEPSRWRLSQPKEKKSEEGSVPVETFRPSRLRLSQPRIEKVEEGLHRVRNGRVCKASAKARK